MRPKFTSIFFILATIFLTVDSSIFYTLKSSNTSLSFYPDCSFQVGDGQIVGYYDGMNKIWSLYNLTTNTYTDLTQAFSQNCWAPASTFMNSKGSVYCGDSTGTYLYQLDPKNSFKVLNTFTPLQYSYGQLSQFGDYFLFNGGWNGDTVYSIFDTTTNQFICQGTFPLIYNTGARLPTSKGYYFLTANSQGVQFYFVDCVANNPTMLYQVPNVTQQVQLESFYSNTVFLSLIETSNSAEILPISFAQNKTGKSFFLPALANQPEIYQVIKVNETHFIITGTNYLSLNFISQDLQITQIKFIQNFLYNNTLSVAQPFYGNNSLLISSGICPGAAGDCLPTSYSIVDLTSFKAITSSPYVYQNPNYPKYFFPLIQLANGSSLQPSANGYFITNPNGSISFISMPMSAYYVDPSNPDYVWGIFSPDNIYSPSGFGSCFVLKIQKSTSSVSQIPLTKCPCRQTQGYLPYFGLDSVIYDSSSGNLSIAYRCDYNYYHVIINNQPSYQIYDYSAQSSSTNDVLLLDPQNQILRVVYPKNGNGIQISAFNINTGSKINSTLIASSSGQVSVSKISERLILYTVPGSSSSTSSACVYDIYQAKCLYSSTVPFSGISENVALGTVLNSNPTILGFVASNQQQVFTYAMTGQGQVVVNANATIQSMGLNGFAVIQDLNMMFTQSQVYQLKTNPLEDESDDLSNDVLYFEEF